jgi:zinc transport system substrate-binding protein
VRKRIATLKSACVFAEPGFRPGLLDAVTEGSGAKQGELDAEGLGIEAGRDAYFQLITGLAGALKSCLSSSS